MKFVKSAALAFALLFVALGRRRPPRRTTGRPVGRRPRSRAPRASASAWSSSGPALGIGGLTASAVESMARQPEIAGNIQTAMIISAALIEGVAFFALIVLGFIIRVS